MPLGRAMNRRLMNRLALATIATDAPMGAQKYETAVASRAAAALAATGRDWRVDRVVARSLRAGIDGTVRLPIGLLERGGPAARQLLGRIAYPRHTLVHRMSLTLPPARHEVVTLHDVVAWRYSDEGTPIASAPQELRAAAAVVCVSQRTADDAKEMFGLENTRVIHLGVDDRFRNPEPLDAGMRDELGLRGRYVLHAGGASTRKNLGALADAWRRVEGSLRDVTLVLSGPPDPRRFELFRGLPRVVFLGRVADGIVPGLIASAEAVVVPSLYEGFGLPVLEAMAAGTPVIAANTSSLPEVAGDGAVLVDPTGDAVAEGIAAVLGGAIDRDGLILRGRVRAGEFTWERCAAEHAAIWNEFAS
jgi:glycosyltransferase involved in cell wall biosynthesis